MHHRETQFYQVSAYYCPGRTAHSKTRAATEGIRGDPHVGTFIAFKDLCCVARGESTSCVTNPTMWPTFGGPRGDGVIEISRPFDLLACWDNIFPHDSMDQQYGETLVGVRAGTVPERGFPCSGRRRFTLSPLYGTSCAGSDNLVTLHGNGALVFGTPNEPAGTNSGSSPYIRASWRLEWTDWGALHGIAQRWVACSCKPQRPVPPGVSICNCGSISSTDDAPVARGAFGAVYKWSSPYSNDFAAVKVLKATDVSRFAEEASFLLATRRHPNVVRTIGVLEQPRAIVMEFVECDPRVSSLREWLQQNSSETVRYTVTSRLQLLRMALQVRRCRFALSKLCCSNCHPSYFHSSVRCVEG